MGADMLDPAKANAFVSVHKDTSPHAPSPSERVSLEMGRDRCQVTVVYAGSLTGPRPYEATTKAGPLGPVFAKLIRGLYFGEEGMSAWAGDRPSDSIAESSLKFDLNFTGEAARRFLTVYDATVKHVIDSEIATDGVDSRHIDPLECDDEETDQPESVMRTTTDAAHRQENRSASLNAINFKSDGEGTVTISATLNAEGLELLEKKIAALKLLIN